MTSPAPAAWFVEGVIRLAFFGHVSIASEFFTGNFGTFGSQRWHLVAWRE
jgi:hypothetical protein